MSRNKLQDVAGQEWDVPSETAIVYFIPLPDRVEILVLIRDTAKKTGSPPVFERFSPAPPVGQEELNREVRRFNYQVSHPDTGNAYVNTARKLYHWLIDPMAGYLEEHSVKTIVFVPDGEIQTIPMSALLHGDKFLVEKYSIGICPTVIATGPRRLAIGKSRC